MKDSRDLKSCFVYAYCTVLILFVKHFILVIIVISVIKTVVYDEFKIKKQRFYRKFCAIRQYI